jgi:hypothetical protein
VGCRVNKAEGEEEEEEEEEAEKSNVHLKPPEHGVQTGKHTKKTPPPNETGGGVVNGREKKHEQQRKCAFNTEFRLGARQFALLDALGAFGHERGCRLGVRHLIC